MGLFTRAVMTRWLARWLFRGSPAAVLAKLAAVGALGAWRYHRKRKRLAAGDPRRIDADYEVLGPDRIAPVGRTGVEPIARAEGTGGPEIDADPHRSDSS